MYNNSSESKKQSEMFSSVMDLNDLHMKCLQEMYLDTCQALAVCGSAASSPSISPTSSTDTTTPSSMLSPLMLSPSSQSSVSHSTSSSGAGNVLSALQQQHLLAVHQQHLAAAAMAQHQLAMAAASAGNTQEKTTGTAAISQQRQDEISKSLQTFAMLTAYTNDHEPTAANVPPQLPQSSPVDAVMQDFACNGYICDELNRYQLGMHMSNTANSTANVGAAGVGGPNATSLLTAAVNQNHNVSNTTSNNAALSQQQQLQQHNINLNFNNNFWKMFPAHHTQAASTAAGATAAATATAAANIDYNSNPKKLPKRNNGGKNDKYTSAKHCVFCENNNEPEAVVKSHSVRDSLGRVLCPKLRTYICPICKASGDMAHTVKYCPQKPIITMEDAIKAESFRLTKNTCYKQQMKV